MGPHILASGTLMGRFGDVATEGGTRAGESGTGDAATGNAATEGYHEARTTVDESGAGAWTTDKKVQH
jgi:hypothetical protein